MDGFHPATARWFTDHLGAPTEVQTRGWASLQQGRHALLVAPTGSGKTLAAFLHAIDQLMHSDPPEEAGFQVVYVSPLKALVYDIERNLRAPLTGIARSAQHEAHPGAQVVRLPRIAIRTGDTPQRERQQMLRKPGDILVTTPESLYLMLGSRAQSVLQRVRLVIVDEVHAMVATKRGAHLALSLERLAALNEWGDPQRVALSATAHPLAEVACFVGGDRKVEIVDTSTPPALHLTLEVPVDDMTKPAEGLQEDAAADFEDRDTTGPDARHSIWPAVHARLVALIRSHRTTLIFVNSRGLAERLAQQLNELAAAEDPASEDPQRAESTTSAGHNAPLVRAHHGSVAEPQRREIEEAMKEGRLPAIVATSSLELGIDMGAIDLVVLIESPKDVARGLQRVGRAGHGVNEVSTGVLLPKHRADLLEATVVAARMREGKLEALRRIENPLDVLAQQVVAMASHTPLPVADLEQLLQRCSPFKNLPKNALYGTLDMLSGNYPSHDFADLRARLVWDRDANVLSGRKGSRLLAAVNGGTIPDRGLYAVHLGEGGPKVGELDEEMVHETVSGQVILLGASSWRVETIDRDRVIVSPAPGEPGKLPFWHGDGPGRPLELGKAVGAFTREVSKLPKPAARSLLETHYRLDRRAATNLLSYLEAQQAASGQLPSDQMVVVERFRDELGDWRVCILSPFGARVHAPWALAIQAGLSEDAGFAVQIVWSDDGIVLTLADGDQPSDLFGEALDALLVPSETIEETLMTHLSTSALFASQFRENAARALLLPRRSPRARTPLWAQRLRAQKLLAVAQNYPSFPILIESYRSTLQDVLDVQGLKEVLRDIEHGRIRTHFVETEGPSPFARSLVFAYVAAYLYEGDSPLAERRAQALSLDRSLLKELLGEGALRDLYDPIVVQEIEDDLQRRSAHRMARNPDGLHHLLTALGDLTEEELQRRSRDASRPWLEALHQARRVFPVRVAGRATWIAAEDVGLYRDALGMPPPLGVPAALLEAVPLAERALLTRYARTRGPFSSQDAAERFGLAPQVVTEILTTLCEEGMLEHGAFTREAAHQWCDREVLRKIHRAAQAKLRREITPADGATLGRFLPSWHGIPPIVAQDETSSPRQPGDLKGALLQLEGVPLSLQDLDSTILPGRMASYRPRDLDSLGTEGWLVFVGVSPLGQQDGRVAVLRREQAPLLLPSLLVHSEETSLPSDVHQEVLSLLEQRGPSFFAAIARGLPQCSTAVLLDALWDLFWRSLITNDTLQAVRTLAKRKGLLRRRRSGMQTLLSGRWSLVTSMLEPEAAAPTAQVHSKVLALLQRYGVVGRAVARKESLLGGFIPHYRVLREMETQGKVQRGYFVEGLGGAQFASPSVVDRLRALREPPVRPEVRVLAATDPANPYGALLPWPPSVSPEDGKAPPPKRSAGARVVLVNGVLTLYLSKGGKRLQTFVDKDDPGLERAAQALWAIAQKQRGKLLRVEEIDGIPARQSPLQAAFQSAGFANDHRGLVLEAF